jgi:peptidyl-prolyl cis-trans isomerase C
MTFKPARLLLALIAASSTLAAPAFAQNLAVVNGKAIPTSRVDAIVKQVVAQGQGQDSPQLREAVKQGYDKKPDVKQALDSARQAIVVNQLARDYIAKNPVTDAEIKAEYDRFSKTQSGEKEYHLRHILLATEDEAKAVIAKLKGGAKFEELAKTSKDTGSAANGGDLDWAAPSAFPPEFAAGFTKLNKGQVTDVPVKTGAGFHVIKVDDVRAVKVPAMEEIKGQIAESLTQTKLAAYQDEMVKKAKVQ